MTIQLDLWALIVGIATVIAAFGGAIWAFAKILGGQIDQRLGEKFDAQEQARETGAKALRDALQRYTDQGERTNERLTELEKRFLESKAELPLHYVRREDYIRGQSILEAKFDAIYNKLELLQLQGAKNG